MATNITPGTQQYADVTNPTGKADSITQDPLTPVEYGRTAAKSAYTTTASSGDPIGGVLPKTGPVASLTLVGTTSTKGDGTSTGQATTSTNGSGCTVTYVVASNVASGNTVVAAGTGYEVGDTVTVTSDTGVTYTVATIS